MGENDSEGGPESTEPRLRRRTSDEIILAVSWEVGHDAQGEQPLVVLRLENPDGDVLRLGFPGDIARELGSALTAAASFGHGSGTESV